VKRFTETAEKNKKDKNRKPRPFTGGGFLLVSSLYNF
jgi:hypothetical protein